MPGGGGDAEKEAGPNGRFQPVPGQRAVIEKEDEGQPRCLGDQIQVAKVNDEEIGEHVGHGADQGWNHYRQVW